MDVMNCIKTRRSIRSYTEQPIENDLIDKIIDAAIWAPSAKNGQPWKIKLVKEKELINKISDLSIYGVWMRTAPCWVFVFLDKDSSYNYIKDVQSCGAAIQNIMLCAHSFGIGSCLIGEILPRSDEVKKLLHISFNNLELMGIVTLGYKSSNVFKSGRREAKSFLL